MPLTGIGMVAVFSPLTIVELTGFQRAEGSVGAVSSVNPVDEPGQVTFSNAVIGRLVIARTEIDRTEKTAGIIATTLSPAAGTNAATKPQNTMTPLQRKIVDIQTANLDNQI